MSEIFVWKDEMKKFYAQYSAYVDIAIRFLFAITVFWLINKNLGYMKGLTSPVITFVLAILGALLPLIMTVMIATVLILAHLYKISLVVLGISALIFIVMYIFYFRFTPEKAWLVLLTAIAFALKVPYFIPIALGLSATPISMVPIACGTIVFYMVQYIHTSSVALKGSVDGGMMASMTTFVNQILTNKEMWIMVMAFAICILVVYYIRMWSADYVWNLAIVAGAITNIIAIVIGAMLLNVKMQYGLVIFGNILAIAIGFILELFLFSVDYTRTERIQFEDDEYYYYVKAIPKIAVSAPRKKVNTINEHKNTNADTENIKRTMKK